LKVYNSNLFKEGVFLYLSTWKFDSRARLFNDVFENGRKRRDTNAAADHDAHVIAMPVLVAFAVRTVNVHLVST